MKNALKVTLVLFAAVLFGFTSRVRAQSINDNDLLEVASGLNVNDQHTDVGQLDATSPLDVKESAKINDKSALGKLDAAKTSPVSVVTDGPEGVGEGTPEGPDLDGPGGSTHQFNGEETGDH
ncbi:MAG: hypothetical protein M1495_23750 [Bacteroidetes bacterium]|nr:hypothetical protein [Bacteroidota bacterium]